MSVAERFDANGLLDKIAKKFGAKVGAPMKAPGATVAERKLAEGGKVDGRTLRKTGRTELFSARVSKQTKDAFQAYASEHDLLLGEVLEFALDALVQSKKSKG